MSVARIHLAQRGAGLREQGVGVAVERHLERLDLQRQVAQQRRRDGDQRAANTGMGDEEDADGHAVKLRSEEHTSELQSLMRISYAVFCLKKKKKQKKHQQ